MSCQHTVCAKLDACAYTPRPAGTGFRTGTCDCGVWVQGSEQDWADHVATLHPPTPTPPPDPADRSAAG